MDVEILQKNENKLLNRLEVLAVVKHPNSPTPKRDEIRKKLAAMLGVSENLVVVKKILSSYGLPVSRVWANVYQSEEELRKIEPHYILRRNGLLQEASAQSS